MGRKTYESLGRLLPNRTTVIVTRNPNFQVQGALIAHSLEQALALCHDDDEAFLIGGAELYQAGLSLAKKMYVTAIDLEVAGDAYFPEWDVKQWQQTGSEAHTSAEGLPFSYLTYQRQAS
jgi:dihydrofolate reductase